MTTEQLKKVYGFHEVANRDRYLVWQFPNGHQFGAVITITLDDTGNWVFAKAEFNNVSREPLESLEDVLKYIRRYS